MYRRAVSNILKELILTFSVPCNSESCIEIKIKLNFYFHTSLWASKGFMKVLALLYGA